MSWKFSPFDKDLLIKSPSEFEKALQRAFEGDKKETMRVALLLTLLGREIEGTSLWPIAFLYSFFCPKGNRKALENAYENLADFIAKAKKEGKEKEAEELLKKVVEKLFYFLAAEKQKAESKLWDELGE